MATKRFLKRLGILLSSLLALIAILYFARRPLFESTIADYVESTLASILDADIEITSIGGNWLTEFTVAGVDIRGNTGSAYEEILDLDLTLQLSLIELIGGDLSGLHLAKVKAERVVLNFEGNWQGSRETKPSEGDSSPSWRDLCDMFAQGVAVEVAELLLKPDYVEPGPCQITLAPGRDRREIVVESGNTKILGHIDRQGRYGIEVSGDQSGRLLRALGVVERTTNSGALTAMLSGQTDPQRVALELEFETRLENGTAIGSRCDLELRDGRLIASRLDVDFPGVSVQGRNLDIPIAQLSNKELRELLQHQGTGQFTANITDLDPYLTLLPDAVVALLPITGYISLDVHRGTIHLRPSLLHAKGIDLRLTDGSFSLVDLESFSVDQLRSARATGLEIKLTAREPMAIELGPIGNLSWTGTLDATVSGTVFDPSFDANLHLQDVSLAEYRVARLECGVSYQAGTLTVTGLILDDAERDGQLLVSSATGSASLHLPETEGDAVSVSAFELQVDRPDIAGTIALDSLRFGGTAEQREIAVSGRIDIIEIDPNLFESSMRNVLPKAPFAMQIRASAIGDVLDVAFLKLAWGSENDRLIAIDAKGPFPIRWTPGSKPSPRHAGEPFIAELHLVDDEPIPGQPRVEIRAALAITADEFRISTIEISAANGRIMGDGLLLGLGPIDLLAGEASLASTPIAGKLVVHEYVLGNVLSKLLPNTTVVGQLDGEVSLAGTVARPIIEGTLAVLGGRLERAGLPEMQDIQIGAAFSQNRITLDGKATIAGQTTIEVSAHLQSGDLPLWEAEPSGAATFSDLPLQMLPKQWIDVSDLSGTISGDLAIGGTWDDLRPTLNIELSEVSCKIPALPRFENLNAKITADATKCTLIATGDLGAAPVEINATWTAAEGRLAEGFLAGTVDATIQGTDVLLARTGGLKIRGDVDLTAKGTVDKIAVRGTIGISNSKYIKRLSLVPDLKMKGGAASTDVFGPWSFPGGERFDFDIRLETIEPITVATNILDAQLDLGCNLVGQGSSLHLEGACVSRTGKLRFPGMAMNLSSMRMVFSQANPTRPDIYATANGQRHGIRIQLQAIGPWDDPVVTLTSSPPLQPKELWALATTGVRPDSLTENNARTNTSILATYVIQEVLLSYFASESTEAGESFVSRFTFEFGNEISRDGEETWQVDFDIGGLWTMPPRIGMRVERDVYEDLNMGLVYRWRF